MPADAVPTDARSRILALDGIPEIRDRRRPRRLHRRRHRSGRPGALPLTARGRARRDPEDRVEGRGRRRRPDRPSSRGPRPSSSPSATTATRARSRSSCARRAASSGWRTACSSPRRRTGSSAPTAAIDASNVGPESGSVVTLLPRDPDASAARSGAAVRAASASTSRSSCPTRSAGHGAGASSTSPSACPGCCRSRTCAASPDADGRVMQSTVRAVADELASAAELALGKTAGRPVALVRGASFTRGEATIRDAAHPEPRTTSSARSSRSAPETTPIHRCPPLHQQGRRAGEVVARAGWPRSADWCAARERVAAPQRVAATPPHDFTDTVMSLTYIAGRVCLPDDPRARR